MLLLNVFVFQTKIHAARTHVKMKANVIHLAIAFIVIASLALVENIVKKVNSFNINIFCTKKETDCLSVCWLDWSLCYNAQWSRIRRNAKLAKKL